MNHTGGLTHSANENQASKMQLVGVWMDRRMMKYNVLKYGCDWNDRRQIWDCFLIRRILSHPNVHMDVRSINWSCDTITKHSVRSMFEKQRLNGDCGTIYVLLDLKSLNPEENKTIFGLFGVHQMWYFMQHRLPHAAQCWTLSADYTPGSNPINVNYSQSNPVTRPADQRACVHYHRHHVQKETCWTDWLQYFRLLFCYLQTAGGVSCLHQSTNVHRVGLHLIIKMYKDDHVHYP